MVTVLTSNTERNDFRNRMITVSAEWDRGRVALSIAEEIQSKPAQLAELIQDLLNLTAKAEAFL